MAAFKLVRVPHFQEALYKLVILGLLSTQVPKESLAFLSTAVGWRPARCIAERISLLDWGVLRMPPMVNTR
jgi:hypothetical protein